MKRFTPILAALLLALFIISSVQSQVNSNLAGAIAQLLDHPAPPPPPPKELAEAMAAMKSIQVYGDPPDPGEDAPIKILMAYWETQAKIETGKLPSEKVRQRLLQACEDEPIFPTTLFGFFPNTPDMNTPLKTTNRRNPTLTETGSKASPAILKRSAKRGLWRKRGRIHQTG
jgi:hypothetical protein